MSKGKVTVQLDVFCDKAPEGWRCSRAVDHDGPCADSRTSHSIGCSYIRDQRCQECDCGFWPEDVVSQVLPRPFLKPFAGLGIPAYGNEKTQDEIIAGLREELAKSQAATIYSAHVTERPIFAQGDKAHKICDLVTAAELNAWVNAPGVFLTKQECGLLADLIQVWVVGPFTRKVIEKIKAAA